MRLFDVEVGRMMLYEKCPVYNFCVNGDARGQMVVIEGNATVPFEVKRLFYIYGTDPSAVRGQHANRNSEFVLICVHGSCKVKIMDGKEDYVVNLDSPMKGVYIPKMLWKDMYDFSEDAVLLVLANTHYDAMEYIKDFDEYVRIMNGTA